MAPQDPDSQELPKRVQARIRAGSLCLGSLTLPLPIRGTGEFEVCYAVGCGAGQAPLFGFWTFWGLRRTKWPAACVRIGSTTCR